MAEQIHATLGQVQEIAQALATKVKNKNYAVSSTTLEGYGITDAYTKSQVDAAIAEVTESATAAYHPVGSIAGNALTADLLVESNFANVYNLSSDLAVTSSNEALFKDRADGDTISAGDNVAVIEAGTYSAATGTAAANTTYFERSGEEGSYTYTEAEVEVGESVSGYYTKDYVFDVMAGIVAYTEGDAIDITSHGISVELGSTTNGLSVSNGLQLAAAVADTHAFTATSDSVAQSGVTYYERSGSDPDYTYTVKTGLTVGTSSVTGLYVDSVSTQGTGGAMTSADKYKLDSIRIATQAEVTAVCNALSLD